MKLDASETSPRVVSPLIETAGEAAEMIAGWARAIADVKLSLSDEPAFIIRADE